jgi:hypothetical protein
MEKPTPERRHQARPRTLKGATAVFSDGAAAINCVVRNLTDRGALLSFESIVGIPPVFTLILDDRRITRRCVVEHRHPNAIGVAFLDATGRPLTPSA